MFGRFHLKPHLGSPTLFTKLNIYKFTYNATEFSLLKSSKSWYNTNAINTNDNKILNGFFNSVELYPYRFALIYDGNGITYHDLYYRVLQCATYLRDKYNILPSDVIACNTSNRPEFLQLILSSHILNCTFIPLHSISKPSMNAQLIKNTNAKLIVYEKPLPINDTKNICLEELCTDFNNEYSWIGYESQFETSLDKLQEKCSNILNSNGYNLSNICNLMSTSGTTGQPKLASHSFKNVEMLTKLYEPILFRYYENEDIFNPSEYPSGVRILLSGATFHITTYIIMTTSATHGHCAVIPTAKQKADVSEMWKLIHLYKINASCFLSSSIYSLLKYGQSIDGNHFKCAYITGEIIPCELIRKFMKLMANGINNKHRNDLMRIINFYGCTECPGIGFSDPISINCYNDDDLYDKIMKIRKVSENNLQINNDGELQISSPYLMSDYYGDLEKTNQAISYDENDMDKRWYLVGEQVTFMDDKNELFIINARNKDIFITDGGVCYPQSVENVLLTHDLVNGAVVIGVEYHHIYIDVELPGLDQPIAYVTIDRVKMDMDDDELIDELLVLCEEYLQKEIGEIPFRIFIVDDLPKTPTGKILRDGLKSIAIQYFEKQKLQYSIA